MYFTRTKAKYLLLYLILLLGIVLAWTLLTQTAIPSTPSITLKLIDDLMPINDSPEFAGDDDYLMKSWNRSNHARQVLIFTRVPKTGGNSFLALLRRLTLINAFRLYHSKDYLHSNLDANEQEDLVREIQQLEGPGIFERHLQFIDFKRYGKDNPPYFSVLREPFRMKVSFFNYVKNRIINNLDNGGAINEVKDIANKSFTDVVLESSNTHFKWYRDNNALGYFCGHESHCQDIFDRNALAQAKHNIEQYYIVVGLLEDLNGTFTLLEHYFPAHFKDAKAVFNKQEIYNKGTYDDVIPDAVEAYCKQILYIEYELYDFVKQRLHRQYLQITQQQNLSLRGS